MLAQLIESGAISSQSDAVRALKERGVNVTQATASRDLLEMGAHKGKDLNGKVRYFLPQASGVSATNSGLIQSHAVSGNIVVLKTPVAAAQYVAANIDRAISEFKLPDAIGTVAGDDTVLVVASTPTGGDALAAKIRDLFVNGKSVEGTIGGVK